MTRSALASDALDAAGRADVLHRGNDKLSRWAAFQCEKKMAAATAASLGALA